MKKTISTKKKTSTKKKITTKRVPKKKSIVKKEYIETSNGMLKFGGMIIPPDISNRHYTEFLKLEKAGEAKRVPDPNFDPWAKIRQTRNRALKGSDWTQLLDNDLSGRDRSAWGSYRKQLRNITSTFNKPENVVWPTPPSS